MQSIVSGTLIANVVYYVHTFTHEDAPTSVRKSSPKDMIDQSRVLLKRTEQILLDSQAEGRNAVDAACPDWKHRALDLKDWSITFRSTV